MRVRYAFELHHDYFGMAALGGAAPQPSHTVTTSNDMGHEVVAQYVIPETPELKTRIVATGEYLQYKSTDSTAGDINQFSRPAFYALIEQSIFKHHVWAAYGQAFEGSCGRVGGGDCSTAHLGAQYATLGYLFAFTEKTNIHLIGYRVFNDASARYATFPALSPIAPGADQMGIGLGVIHAFNVGVLDTRKKEQEKK